jgi:hydrogenase/urease accessory protein HupE
MKLPLLLSITACLFSSPAAFAHEGHGDHANAFDGVLHWFTRGDHVAVLVLSVAAVLLGARAILRGRAARVQHRAKR